VHPSLTFQLRYRVRHYMDDDIVRPDQDEDTGEDKELAGDFGITDVYHTQIGETEQLIKGSVEWRF
jgi:hypothetical protein